MVDVNGDLNYTNTLATFKWENDATNGFPMDFGAPFFRHQNHIYIFVNKDAVHFWIRSFDPHGQRRTYRAEKKIEMIE